MYLTLPIGEIVQDRRGGCAPILWRRTSLRDETSRFEDNYYYEPVECFCSALDSASGYTYEDEYGSCDWCEGALRQINGHNDIKKEAMI